MSGGDVYGCQLSHIRSCLHSPQPSSSSLSLSLPTDPGSATDVAQFLRTCPGLDHKAIGEYISQPDEPKYAFQTQVCMCCGCGVAHGTTTQPSTVNHQHPTINTQPSTQVRQAFVDSFDFTGFTFERALRTYLESFMLPGEAQKIDRVVSGVWVRGWM